MSFDQLAQILTFQILGFDGQAVQRGIADSMSIKLVESGNIMYIAMAAPGTAESDAKWQARKMDATTGLVITWADSNAEFDNVATDLASLTYG